MDGMSPLPKAPHSPSSGGPGSPNATTPGFNGTSGSPTSSLTPSISGVLGGGGMLGTSQANKNVTVERKVQKLLEITFNETMKESLDELDRSGFDSAACASGSHMGNQRKQMKATLEQRVLALHETFLERFTVTRNAYKEVSAQIETISECCDAVQCALETDRDARVTVLSNVELLREELVEAQRKEEQVNAFMEQYQLSPEEQVALKGEVTPQFLAVLLKTKKIHDSCQSMLSLEHQQAAVEVMESMYLTQVGAAEKLTRYLVPLTSEILCHDDPHVTQFYVDAVQAIQDKPGQWAKVLHEVSRVRRIAVLRRFYDQVGKATSGGQELTVHDAPRFIGEVLAWVHQCIAEESDLLSFFFHRPNEEEEKRKAAAAGEDTETHNGLHSVAPPIMESHTVTTSTVLDQIFEGLCKHLGDRVDAMLDSVAAFTSGGNQHGGGSSSSATGTSGGGGSSSSGGWRGGGGGGGGGLLLGSRGGGGPGDATLSGILVTLFRMEGLLRFYAEVTVKLLTDRASLSSLLQSRRLNCLRLFFDTLQHLAKAMLSSRTMTADYSVPVSLMDVFQTLTSMLESLQGSSVPHGEREVEFAPILSAVADPLPQLIDSVFAEVTESGSLPLNPGDGKLVFKLNVYCALRSCIAPYSFTVARQTKLTRLVERHTQALVASFTTQLLKRLGFEEYVDTLVITAASAAVGDVQEGDVQFQAKSGRISSQSLRATLLGFYSSVLSLSGALTIPLLDSLTTYPVREAVRSRTILGVCAAYDVLYGLAMKDATVRDDSKVVEHTPDQVRVLLEAGAAGSSSSSSPRGAHHY